MKKETIYDETITVFIYFVDAKLCRFWADSKKIRQIFSNLCGQTFKTWTNRRKRLYYCL